MKKNANGDMFAQKASASGDLLPGPLTPYCGDLVPDTLPGWTQLAASPETLHPEPKTKVGAYATLWGHPLGIFVGSHGFPHMVDMGSPLDILYPMEITGTS